MLHCVSYENSITVSKWENGSRWGAISISWVWDPVSCHQHDLFSDYRFCYVRLISNCITIKVNVRPWRESIYSISLARFCDLDDVSLVRVKGGNWDPMCLLLQLKSLMIFWMCWGYGFVRRWDCKRVSQFWREQKNSHFKVHPIGTTGIAHLRYLKVIPVTNKPDMHEMYNNKLVRYILS